MSAFSDLLSSRDDELYGDPTEPPEPANPRVGFGGVAEPVAREAIRKVEPTVEPYSVQGLVGNFAKDVGRFGAGIGALMGEVAMHPLDSAGAVVNAAEHPIETAKMLAESLIERYTPQEGEGIVHMLARNAYEHPFDTMLDASTVVQGPFGAAAKVAKVAGAAELAGKLSKVAEVARYSDPITLAQKTGRYILKTAAPDKYALMRTMRANTDTLSEEITRQRFLETDFQDRLLDAEKDLTPAEKAVRFPYAEGRLSFNSDETSITELTHAGLRESRKLEDGSAIRPEALEAWRTQYRGLQDEFERAAGLHPEQFAEKARYAAMRKMMYNPDEITLKPDFNAFSPEVSDAGEKAYQDAYAEALERKQRRAAISTLTALDVAKERVFREKAAQYGIDETRFKQLQEATGLPHPWEPPTLQEALDIMGDNGGVIVPHSGEVLSREQSTVRNVLTKAQESHFWEENTGAMFRQGMLQQLDPAAALSRSYRLAIRGDTFSKVAEDAAQVGVKEGLVKEMPAIWKPHMDPDVRAGTHQALHPATLALDGSIGEHFERLKSRLMEVAPYDEAAAGMNLADIADNMGAAAHRTFPINPRAMGKLYKVPTGMGDALAMFKKSFEPTTNPLATISDKWVMGPFNLMTLNMKGGRILNNGVGNTDMVAAQGLHPFTARGFMGLMTMGRATLGHFDILNDPVSKSLAKVFELPGVSGGISTSETLRDVSGLGERMAAGRLFPKASPAVQRILNNPVTRGIGKWTNMMQVANQNLENIYRAGSTIYEMLPSGLESIKNMIHGSATMADMGERFAKLRGMGVEAMKEADLTNAVKGMNRWLNNYDKTSALDRLTGRYVFPYHKFYRHSAELLMRAPFEKPVQAQLVRRVGAAALQDVKDQLASYGYDWNTMVPEAMRTSVPMHETTAPDGSKALVMFNTQGPNPFSMVSMGGDIGGMALNGLNPLIKVAIEQATGVNLFTREKFQGALSTFNGRKTDPETGAVVEDYERPPLVDHYLRQFWPYQTLRDVVAHGRSPRDAADLVDMAMNPPGTYRLDEMGREVEKPRAVGALTPFARIAGAPVGIIQPPTARQAQTQQATTAETFSDLWQQHPEKRTELLAALREAARTYRRPAGQLNPRYR